MFLKALFFHAPWRLRKWQPSRTLGHAAESHQLKLQMVPEPNCFGTDDPEGIIGNSLSKTTTLSQKSQTTFTLPFFEARPNRRDLAAEPRCKLQMSVSSTPNAHFWCLPFLDDHFVDVESPFSGVGFQNPNIPYKTPWDGRFALPKTLGGWFQIMFLCEKITFTSNSWIAQILDAVGYRIPHATEKAGQPSRHHPIRFSTLTC